jgi:hypothetical protein
MLFAGKTLIYPKIIYIYDGRIYKSEQMLFKIIVGKTKFDIYKIYKK